MGILVLGTFYDHVTVLTVKENVNIKKAQGGGSYKGTQLNFEDSEGEVKSAKWQQDWLDNKYQKELKDSIQALKPGDEVTLYKEKTVDEDKYNAITEADAKKKAGFWTVKKIYQGHIEPPESEAPAKKSGAKKAAAPKQANKAKFGDNLLGVKVGHSIKGATTLCLRLKKPFLEAAKEVHSTTAELQKEYQAATGLDDYTVGQTVGNAVLNACFLASPKADIKTIARKILNEYMPEIQKYIQEQENPVANELAVEVEASEPDFDDDLPF